jgi:hypothetical protein
MKTVWAHLTQEVRSLIQGKLWLGMDHCSQRWPRSGSCSWKSQRNLCTAAAVVCTPCSFLPKDGKDLLWLIVVLSRQSYKGFCWTHSWHWPLSREQREPVPPQARVLKLQHPMLASISPTAPPPRWVMMSLEGSSVSPQPGRRGQWWLMWYWWEISFWWAKHWHVLTRASCYTAQFSILLDTVPNFLPNASKYTSLSVTSSWAFSALRPCPLVVWTTGWRQYIPPTPTSLLFPLRKTLQGHGAGHPCWIPSAGGADCAKLNSLQG